MKIETKEKGSPPNKQSEFNILNFINKPNNTNTFNSKINIEDMFTVAKRLNNKKRDYLFVNKHLGKHIACDTTDVKMLANELSRKIIKNHKDKLISGKTLIISFAETATLLGNNVFETLLKVGCSNLYYVQTTRQKIEDDKTVTKVKFGEIHSHIVENYLYLKNIDKYNKYITNIIFIEDEITTGNTILNLKKNINNIFGDNVNYICACILNTQSDEDLEKFQKHSIENIYLYKATLQNKDKKINISDNNRAQHITTYYKIDNIINKVNDLPKEKIIDLSDLQKNSYGDLYDYKKYNSRSIVLVLKSILQQSNTNNIEILGVQEDMYIPYKVACELSKKLDTNVRYRATTLSPITVNNSNDNSNNSYIFNNRIEFMNYYGGERKSYLYNIPETGYLMMIFILPELYGKQHEEVYRNNILKSIRQINKNIEVMFM